MSSNNAPLYEDSSRYTGFDPSGASGAKALTGAYSLSAATNSPVNVTGLTSKSQTAGAITAATVLVAADSGGVFSVSQAAAYDIDLPAPTQGMRYTFYLTGPANNAVTVTVAGAAATFVGTIVNDVTSVIPATGSTLTFAANTALLGDNIECIGISSTLYLVRAITQVASGITIA